MYKVEHIMVIEQETVIVHHIYTLGPRVRYHDIETELPPTCEVIRGIYRRLHAQSEEQIRGSGSHK